VTASEAQQAAEHSFARNRNTIVLTSGFTSWMAETEAKPERVEF